MSVAEGPKSAGLVARVQGILFRPSSEWDVIAAEPATLQGLFTGYACILAAIPAIAGLVGGLVFGWGAIFGFRFHPSLVSSIGNALATYISSLIAVFVLGLVIEALAPSFQAEKDRVRAMKVAVYAMTAPWLAGVLLLVPALPTIAFLCGFYGLYLLYVGLPKLMKPPEDKALGYILSTIVVAFLLQAAILGVEREMSGFF